MVLNLAEGVGIELRGTANRTINVAVDSVVSPIGSPPTGVLFSINGLASESHSIQLTLPQDSSDGLVQFDSAILISSTPDQSCVDRFL